MTRRTIKPNCTTRHPRHWVAVDTETRPRESDGGGQVHEVWHWCACAYTIEGGRAGRSSWESGADPAHWWRWLYARLSPRHTTWVVAHWAGYDLTALRIWAEIEAGRLVPRESRRTPDRPGDLDDAEQDVGGLIVVEDPPTILDMVTPAGHRVVFVDLLNWLPMPLARIGASFGVDKLPDAGASADDAYWVARCKRDVEIVRAATVGLTGWVTANKLGVMRYTASDQSLQAWRHGRRDCDIVTGHADGVKAMERAAYYPGVTRPYFLGRAARDAVRPWAESDAPGRATPQRWDAPVYRLDMNGCYPFCMEINDFPVKYLYFELNPTVSRTDKLLDIFEGVATVSVSSRDDPYPIRTKQGVRWARGRITTALAGPELRVALAKGHVTAVHELHLHQRGRPFGAFCRMVEELKVKYRSENNDALLKATKDMANALHGKFGQWGGGWVLVRRPPLPYDWGYGHTIDATTKEVRTYRAIGRSVQRWAGRVEKPDNYPLIAAYTASYARLLMWEMIDAAGAANVYYQDVDSIHVNQAGFDNLTQWGLIDPHSPGRLKIEAVADDAEWWGPKNYRLGEHRVCAGVSPRAQIGPDGHKTQVAWARLGSIIQHAPPGGPVSRGMLAPEPAVRIDGVLSPDGGVDWPTVQ